MKEVDGGGSGLDADQLDGLSSADFVSSESFDVVGLQLDDPSPNDLVPGPSSGLVMSSKLGDIVVQAGCYDRYSGGGGSNDYLFVNVNLLGGGSINGVNGSGATIENADTSFESLIDLFEPDGTVLVQHASFVATTDSGDVMGVELFGKLNVDGDCSVAGLGFG